VSAPRWARLVLSRLAAEERVDEVLGDLDEAHRIRVERRGRVLAAVLTSLETIDMAFALRWHRGRIVHRLRRTVPPDLRAARRRRMPPVSWLDFKLGLRMLARFPGMTAVGGAAMALGIAIGAGGLHLLSELVYPDRPYEDPDRIVGIQNVDLRTGSANRYAIHDFERWRDALSSVEHVGAFMFGSSIPPGSTSTLGRGPHAELAHGGLHGFVREGEWLRRLEAQRARELVPEQDERVPVTAQRRPPP
jgi:hypothetical protein